MRYLVALAGFFILLAVPFGMLAAAFVIPEENSVVSEDGTLQLEWEGSGADASFRIERSKNPEFLDPSLVYQGPDTATFVSGLTEGDHYFRLREGDRTWSDGALRVRVEFVSQNLVTVLLCAGTLCLTLLVFFLVQGHLGKPGGGSLPAQSSKPGKTIDSTVA